MRVINIKRLKHLEDGNHDTKRDIVEQLFSTEEIGDNSDEDGPLEFSGTPGVKAEPRVDKYGIDATGSYEAKIFENHAEQ